MELLAPAGSPEALQAAVQAGADAVYLGFGPLNARRNAKNFTREQLEEGNGNILVRGENFKALFSRMNLGMVSYGYGSISSGAKSYAFLQYWCALRFFPILCRHRAALA